MPQVTLIDTAGALSPAEFAQLESFIIDDCLCGTDDLRMLRHVELRNDGASGYSGYWSASYTLDGADVKDIQAVIVLNSFYLRTVTQMERTLAHEFGHHWTIGYLMDRQEMIGWFDEAAPRLYYRIRGLDPGDFAKDYSKGWTFCDKEVLAEDYKYQFSPYRDGHRMAHLVNNPTAEVGTFIRSLGRPVWAP
jgi:hypothetical protein